MKYFLHDSNAFSDEKITQLYIKFGYEGVGLFFTTLEKFAAQEKPINTIVLKRQLNVKKRLNKCWEFMEEIGIISSLNGDSFNEQLLNYAGTYQIKKEKTAKRVAEWRLKHENVTRYERVSNTSKVKLSKVKLSKVNRIGPLYVDFEKSTLTTWNSFCENFPILPKIKEISEKRREKLKKRFEVKSFRNFPEIIAAIKEQPFCLGDNDRKWTVSFDWLIENDTNYLKVLELKYKSDKVGNVDKLRAELGFKKE